MLAFRTILLSCWLFWRVLFRRLFKGALHSGWSFRFEWVSAILRTTVKRAVHTTPAVLRRLTPAAPVRPGLARQVSNQEGLWGHLPCLWVTPEGWTQEDGTMLYLHGGGYIVCSYASHRELITRLAVTTGWRLLAVDYRLAPEHPFPAAIDDAYGAYLALLQSDIPAEKLAVAGDSAGGGLSLALLTRLRDTGLPLPSRALLLSPWVDLTVSTESVVLFEKQCYLSADVLRCYARHYCGGENPAHPLISPIEASLAGLPPITVVVGEVETLRDESRLLVQRAREAGVWIQAYEAPGLTHVWPAFAGFAPDCRIAFEVISDLWNRMDVAVDGQRQDVEVQAPDVISQSS
jgi:monoterpene epsilon-lactone hydrolase